MYWLLMVFMMGNVFVQGLHIEPQPYCVQKTAEEYYDGKKKVFLYIGKTRRYSSCGGICWFNNDSRYVTINYQGGILSSYDYNKVDGTCSLQHVVDQSVLLGGELIDVSPDQKLIAAISNYTGLIFCPLDDTYGMKDPSLVLADGALHGVRFTHTPGLVGYSSIAPNKKGGVNIMRYTLNEKPVKKSLWKLEKLDFLPNIYHPLQAKSFDFSPDDAYIVVVYANLAGACPKKNNDTAVVVYSFDASTGCIDKNPVCVRYVQDTVHAYEDVRFYKNSHIVISDQANHMLVSYTFDPIAGQLSEHNSIVLDNAQGSCASPHGIAFFDNFTKLSVTNYGLDAVCFFDVTA